MPPQKTVYVNPDGRRLYVSNMGAAGGLVLQESSESEEELPPPPAPMSVFASVMHELRTGHKYTSSASSTNVQSNVANSSRSHREPAATPNNRNRPNSIGTEADRRREAEASIKQLREGYLRTTAAICKKQHKVLVCQWSSSDPTNRKGTWSLEVLDFRRTIWLNDVGVEEHKQCSVDGTSELLNKLATAMIDQLREPVPAHIAHQPNSHRRQLLEEQLDSRQVPPIARIERELSSLAAYVMADITQGSAGVNVGDKGRKLDKQPTKTNGEAARKEAELAALKETTKNRAGRREDDVKRIEKTSAPKPETRGGNKGVRAPTNKTQKAAPKKGATLALTDADKKLSKSIRAAEGKDRKRQEQEEQEEEERQQELIAQRDDVDDAAAQEESPDDGLTATALEALDNAPEKKSANEGRKAAGGSRSIVKAAVDETQSKARKRRLKPRAHVRPVVEDSSDSDSVRPPQPSKPANLSKSKQKSKQAIKPTIRKPTVRFADHLAAKKAAQGEGSGAKQPSHTDKPSGKPKADGKPEKKEMKTMKTKTNKTHTSEGLVAESDLEDDTTDAVTLLNDKSQNGNMSVERLESTSLTMSTEQTGDVVEQGIQTTTVAVEAHHDDNSTTRTEVTATTAVSSTSSSKSETTVQHALHTHVTTNLDVPAHNTPHNSPPPSPERGLRDGFTTPTNALGIDVTISAPPPATASSPRKRKSPPTERGAGQQTDTSPPPPKKRKTTPPAPENNAPSTPRSSQTTASGTGFSSPTGTVTPLSSPAASVASSPASNKRKAPWTAEGEVATSPFGTKRAKRGQSGGVAVSEETEVGETDGEGKGEVSTGMAGLEDEDVEVDDDQASFDSLFDESSSERD